MLRIKIFFLSVLIVLWCTTEIAAQGVEWRRFRVLPKISISQSYTDNALLTNKDERSEFITTISPALFFDFAFAPRNFISLSYEGDFRFPKEFDNFKRDIHQSGLSWQWTSPKGSKVLVGGNMLFDSIQPFSDVERSKDFVTSGAFVDTLFKLWPKTELGLKYDFLSRSFEDSQFKEDDFDSNTIALSIFYKLFTETAVFLQYSYNQQNNPEDPARDTDANIVYIGARWDPTAKLSGVLKLGYRKTDIRGGDDTGFDTDTDLAYKFSDITEFRLIAFHRFVTSTRVDRRERDSDFFISRGGSLSVTYRKWEPLTLSTDFFYRNNDFEDRQDNFFQAGLKAKYSLRGWLSISLSYQYNQNDSNDESQAYKENRMEALLSLSI